MNSFKLTALPLIAYSDIFFDHPTYQYESTNSPISQSLIYYTKLTRNHLIVQKTNMCENISNSDYSDFNQNYIKTVTNSDNPFDSQANYNNIVELLQMKINEKWNSLTDNITYLHISPNNDSINAVKNELKPKQIQLHISLPIYQIPIYPQNIIVTADIIFFEFNDNIYANTILYEKYMLKVLLIALLCNNNHGCACIKISHMTTRNIISIIYTLTQLYKSCHIINPTTTNSLSQLKYIVCCNKRNNISQQVYKNLTNNVLSILLNNNLIDVFYTIHNIPLAFITKIEDINNVLGKKQLSAIDSISDTLSCNSTMSNIIKNLSSNKNIK